MRVNNIDVQSVAFGVDQIEVVYAEERDINSKNGVIEYRTIVVPAGLIEETLADTLDSVAQLIDAAQVAKRNPANTIR